MAFGKNREKVGNMNLRQQMRRGSKRPPKGSGGGGGGAPYFVNKYQPPDAGPADIIRVIPGIYPTARVDFDAKDYVRNEAGNIIMDPYPYVKYIEYYHGTRNRSCIGSEGPLGNFKGKGDPCVAMDWYWYEWRERQRTGNKAHPKSMSQREKFAFTVLVQAPFYKVPRTDDNGQFKMNETTNEPYYDWLKGSKRANDEYAQAGYERKEGHLQHWSMGSAHWNTLTEYTDSLAKHCRACSGHDCIEEVALVCQHCGDAVVEFATTSLSDEDIDKVRSEEAKCPTCEAVDYLDDVIRCTNCNQGEQATLFDFDLNVKRVKTAGAEGNQTTLQILSALGPRPIDQLYGDDLRKPLPLDKIFAPTPIAKQIELFGEVPSAGQAAPEQQQTQGSQRQPSTKGARSYGG